MVEKIAAEEAEYTLYYGTFVHTPTLGKLEILKHTLIGVDKSGTIDFMKQDIHNEIHGTDIIAFYKQETKCAVDASQIKVVDISNEPLKFFLPGFIDTHIHASQYPNLGVGLGCPLLEWLNEYTFPLESSFTDNNREGKLAFARDVYSRVIKKTLVCGTTCASYFATIDADTTRLLADLCLEAGQRAFVGKVCMDDNSVYPEYQEDYDTCVKSMEAVNSHIESINPKSEVLVKPIVTPRFAPVCSRKLLSYLGNLAAEKNLPVQTHLSENTKEIELVRTLFPECKNYTSVYDDYHLLKDTTILAHGIHLDKDECNLIKKKGSTIAHCPMSNSFISSGESPVRKYLYEYNINVSLGTDVSGGFKPSILETIKHSILASQHLHMHTKHESFDPRLTVADTIYMATMGGATGIGLQNVVGSFAIGKKWDTQLIEVDSSDSNIDIFGWNERFLDGTKDSIIKYYTNLLNIWVFTGDDRNCTKVWCNGRKVIDKSK